MERFIDYCCEECAHSKKTPCAEFVECRLEGPLCHDNDPCRDARKAIVNKVDHRLAFRKN